MRSVVVFAAILIASEALLLGNFIGARNRRITSRRHRSYHNSAEAKLLEKGLSPNEILIRNKRSTGENNVTEPPVELEEPHNESNTTNSLDTAIANQTTTSAIIESTSQPTESPKSSDYEDVTDSPVAEKTSTSAGNESNRSAPGNSSETGYNFHNNNKEEPSSSNLVLDICIGIICVLILLINIVNIVILLKNKGKCQGSKKSKDKTDGSKSAPDTRKAPAGPPSLLRARGGSDDHRESSKDIHLLPRFLTMKPADYFRYGAAGHPKSPPVQNSAKLMEDLCRELTGDRKFYDDTTVEGELEQSTAASECELNLDLRGFEEVRL